MWEPTAAAAGAAPAQAAVPFATLLCLLGEEPKFEPCPKKGAGLSAEPPPPVPRQEAAPAGGSPAPNTRHAARPLHQQAGAAAAKLNLELDAFCCPITLVSARCYT